MPRNGVGVYTLPATSWNPATTGGTIESNAWNTTGSDIAAALTQSISKDGQTVWTGQDNHGNNKIVNVADGSSAQDAMSYGQGAKLAGGNTFTGTQTFNGAVVLSGSVTVSGPVIFSGSAAFENLGVASVLSATSALFDGVTTQRFTASVATVGSLVASTASIHGKLFVGSVNVTSVPGPGTITVASAYYVNDANIFDFMTVQREYSSTTSYLVCSTVIPDDDSIPQNTEGREVLSGTITPKYSGSLIYVTVSMQAYNNSAVNACVALFRNSSADAVAARQFGSNTATFPKTVSLVYRDVNLTTAAVPITYRVRVGPASGEVYINGNSVGRTLGGVSLATLDMTEVAQVVD